MLPSTGAPDSSVIGRPTMRAIASIHASSPGSSMWSEMISIVPWPASRSASAMATISSALAWVPGTTWPCLLRCP